MNEIDYNNYEPPPPLDKLQHLDHPLSYKRWWEKEPDFIKDIGLDRGHIPQLIELSKVWAYRTEWPEDEDDLTMFAPIHAWRVLGHLKALESVEPLIGLLNRLDEIGDDWFLEEFLRVFKLIGPETIPYLKAFAMDGSNRTFARTGAWDSLSEVARRYPETRDEVIAAISSDLENAKINDATYNGLLISNLLELKAVESAESIERAYATVNVDESVVGWDEVMQRLGVKGTGIIPEKYLRSLKHKPVKPLPYPISSAPVIGTGSKKKDSKAKRKKKAKSRKRNRKRK